VKMVMSLQVTSTKERKKKPLELHSHLAHKKVAKWFKVLNKLQICQRKVLKYH